MHQNGSSIVMVTHDPRYEEYAESFGVAPNLELIQAAEGLGEAERAEIASVYQFHRSLASLEAPLER